MMQIHGMHKKWILPDSLMPGMLHPQSGVRRVLFEGGTSTCSVYKHSVQEMGVWSVAAASVL